MEKRNPIIRSLHHQLCVEKRKLILGRTDSRNNMLVGRSAERRQWEKNGQKPTGTHLFLLRDREWESIVGVAAAAGEIYLLVRVLCGRFHLYFIATSLAIFPYLLGPGPNLWSSVAKKNYHRTIPILNSTRDTNKSIRGIDGKRARCRAREVALAPRSDADEQTEAARRRFQSLTLSVMGRASDGVRRDPRLRGCHPAARTADNSRR